MIEIGQAQIGAPPHHLQPAAGVHGVIPEQAPAHAIADLRSHPLGPAVLALQPHAADQAHGRAAGLQSIDQPRSVGRVVLAVAVQGDQDGAPRRLRPGAHRAALAGVPLVRQHPELRQGRLQGLQHRDRAVAAGVVDEDHLIGLPLEGGRDLSREGSDIALFVEDRDHHRDLGGRCRSSRHGRLLAGFWRRRERAAAVLFRRHPGSRHDKPSRLTRAGPWPTWGHVGR